MSGVLVGAEWTVTTTPTSVQSILGATPRRFPTEFAFRAKKSNLGTIYWGTSTVTTTANRHGYIDAGEAVGFSPTRCAVDMQSTYVVGTQAGDTLFISLIE